MDFRTLAFDPEPESRVDYFSLAKRSDAYGMTSPFTADGLFREIVAPDVLYSWMSQENLDRILRASNPRAVLPAIGRRHFLWRTPVGSFGYGMVSMRLKLKDGVTFALIRHLRQSDVDYAERFEFLRTHYDLDNTVFVSEIPLAGYGTIATKTSI